MAEEAEATVIEPDAAVTSEHVDGDEDVARARRMGWIPKDEYGGDPDNWRSAKDFIERGENEMPILRERLRKQDGKIASQEAELVEVRDTIEQFKGWASQSDRRAYARAVKDLEAKQRAAVEVGDTEAFDEVGQEIKDLSKTFAAPAPRRQAPGTTTEVIEPEVTDWVDAPENNWFKTDEAMANFAIAYHGQLQKERPGLTLDENLKAVTAEVRKRFADKFENPRARSGSPVEGSGGKPGGANGRGYSNLPAEAKEACDKFIKQGLVTREEYLKDYEWE